MPANAEPAAAVPHRPSSRAFISGLCLGLLVAGGFFFGIIASALGFLNPFAGAATTRPLSQAKAATPVGYSKIWGRLFVNSVEELVTGGHQARVMEWLGGAVGFFLSRTKSHDHVEPTAVEDPGLQVFKLLYDYLPDAVSYAHSTLSLTEVNIWNLVYVWIGSDDSPEPTAPHEGDMLMDQGSFEMVKFFTTLIFNTDEEGAL